MRLAEKLDWKGLKLQEVKASRICRQPKHERNKVVSSMHRLPLPNSREHIFSFPIEADSIPCKKFDRKEHENSQ
jgi:hypothetical protein